MSLALHDSTIG